MDISKNKRGQTKLNLHPARWLLCLAIVVTFAGCRFNVGILRGILGDLMEPSAFERRMDVDLTDGTDRLLILCSASHGVMNESASLPIDLLERVSGQLRNHGVDVVDTDDVANWLDDNGSLDDLPSLATEFDADYIAVIRIQNLSYTEPNSDLLRARATGDIRVHKVMHNDDGRVEEQYGTGINEVYPKTYPISADKLSHGMFQRDALNYLSDVFARQFHRYHQRDTI